MRRPAHGATSRPGPPGPASGYGRALGRPGPHGDCGGAEEEVTTSLDACFASDAAQDVISASAAPSPGEPGTVPAI
jgi:hypothetical protein